MTLKDIRMPHVPSLPKELEHTLRAWVARVGTDSYRSIREVFPGDAPTERAHRRNCRLLVRKGLLEPEPAAGSAVAVRRMSTDQLMGQRFHCSA
jgi:hypothetical protein